MDNSDSCSAKLKKVAYLGPRGTFSEETALGFYRGVDGQFFPYTSIDAVIRAVAAGEAIGCFGLTEPGSGSDSAGVESSVTSASLNRSSFCKMAEVFSLDVPNWRCFASLNCSLSQKFSAFRCWFSTSSTASFFWDCSYSASSCARVIVLNSTLALLIHAF